MRVPSKSDWGVIDKNDIELQYAFDMFFGKTREEAKNICEERADNYQEELQSMPVIPFNFYAPILANYIVSESAKEDSDGVSCYLDMVAWMLKTQSSIIAPETKNLLISSARIVSQQQSFYDASPSIYGRFEDKYSEIKKCI